MPSEPTTLFIVSERHRDSVKWWYRDSGGTTEGCYVCGCPLSVSIGKSKVMVFRNEGRLTRGENWRLGEKKVEILCRSCLRVAPERLVDSFASKHLTL